MTDKYMVHSILNGEEELMYFKTEERAISWANYCGSTATIWKRIEVKA